MDETKLARVWVLGGDQRYFWAARKLRQDGLPVRTWAVPGMENQAASLEETLSGAELVLLPMNALAGEELAIGGQRLPAALLPQYLGRDAQIFAGEAPEELTAWLASQHVRWHNLLEQPGYIMGNAAVTAEGALQIILERLTRTVQGAEILIIGWGRIGKFLAGKLKALGANVTVAARREEALAEIAALGLTPEKTGVYALGLSRYHVICNTVPWNVVSEEQLEGVRGLCLELASAPGGFPQSEKVTLARGLPGKTAPETAGIQLADAVWVCLAGEGRVLE